MVSPTNESGLPHYAERCCSPSQGMSTFELGLSVVVGVLNFVAR